MAEKIYNMQASLLFGKQGEKVIKDYLRKKSYVREILDMRDDPVARTDDVDYILVLSDGSTCPIEIKTDSYASGNIFIEELSDIARKTPGCIIKTKATFIFYYFVNEKVLYIINTQKFLAWYWKNKSRFRFCPAVKNIGYGNMSYSSCGSLVPRKIVEAECGEFVRLRTVA